MNYHLLDLPYEIINFISEFLPITDRQKSKYVCRQMNDAICIRLKDFDDILIKRINEHTNSNIGFGLIELIKESNGYIQIGGNTINQCLHSEFISSSDIDIYITYDPVEGDSYDETYWNYDDGIIIDGDSDSDEGYLDDLIDEIEPMSPLICQDNKIDEINISPQKQIMAQKYAKLCFDLVKNKTDLKLHGYTREHLYYAEANYMIKGYHINFYENENTDIASNHESFIKIQLILLPIKYDKDEIYDFTFSRNRYDGHNVYSKNKIDVINKSGTMNDWDRIYNKAVYSRGCTKQRVCEHMLLRANKYIQRGYNISNLEERMYEIDENIKGGILRNYYRSDSNIIQIRDTKFNDWMYNSFGTCSGIGMATRTIEVVYENENGQKKIVANNKGNPKIMDISSNDVNINK